MRNQILHCYSKLKRRVNIKISIIVPVYNAERFILRLLKSIIAQSYQNYELILVDDGSTDNTYKILEKYKNEKIHVFKKDHEGVGKTRKFGFIHSIGDILFFCDSDDYLPNNYVLETIVKVYKNNDIDLLMFNALEISRKGNNVVNCFSKDLFEEGIYDVNELEKCFLFGSLALKAFKRELLFLNCFCHNCNFEDTYLTYKYLNNCKNFYYLQETLYVIDGIINPMSLTKQKNINKFIETIPLCVKIFKESKLKNSCIISAFNYYIHMISLLNNESWDEKDKKRLRAQMCQLEKIFYNKLSYLKNVEESQKFDKYLLYKNKLIRQKVIVVEGVPTVGKSTIADLLQEQFNKNNIKVKWLHEETENNLIAIKSSEIKDHLQFWQEFLNKVASDDYLYLIDSNFLKIIYTASFNFNCFDNIVLMFQNFFNINKNKLFMVFLEHKDIQKGLLNSFKYRGKFWENHCLKGQNLLTISEKTEEKQKKYKIIYKSINCEKINIYTDDENWNDYIKNILKHFCLNHINIQNKKLDFSKYCGYYECLPWNARVFLDCKNQLCISAFWQKVDLCYIKDNLFKLKSFPLYVQIYDDYLVFSGEYDWNMKNKQFKRIK